MLFKALFASEASSETFTSSTNASTSIEASLKIYLIGGGVIAKRFIAAIMLGEFEGIPKPSLDIVGSYYSVS